MKRRGTSCETLVNTPKDKKEWYCQACVEISRQAQKVAQSYMWQLSRDFLSHPDQSPVWGHEHFCSIMLPKDGSWREQEKAKRIDVAFVVHLRKPHTEDTYVIVQVEHTHDTFTVKRYFLGWNDWMKTITPRRADSGVPTEQTP